MMCREIIINGNPVKLIPLGDCACACGCGGKTNIANKTYTSEAIKKGEYRKFLKGHHFRGKNHRRWNGGEKLSFNYVLVSMPGHPRADVDAYVREHILIAEAALGKFIKPPHVIHHYTQDQLVVCEDQAYHLLLHQRERALNACKHASWKKCWFCKQYGDPKSMTIRIKNGRSGKKGAWFQAEHAVCSAKYEKERHEVLRAVRQAEKIGAKSVGQ